MQLAKIALDDGWQLSDLVRTLVVLGASANWLGLEEMEEGWTQKRDELERITERLGNMLPVAWRRGPYASRTSQDTDVVSLILPAALAQMIGSYADAHGLSKNALCGKLLTEGMMIYLTGEKNLLQALPKASKQQEF